MIIIGFVSFASAFNDIGSSSYSSSSRSPIMSFVPFFIAFIGVIVCGCATTSWAAKIGHQVEGELQKTCDEASRLHPGISFHMRKERFITGHGNRVRSSSINYIEGMCLHFIIFE